LILNIRPALLKSATLLTRRVRSTTFLLKRPRKNSIYYSQQVEAELLKYLKDESIDENRLSVSADRESSVHYRREIDGLRTVAVLPVILFHAGFNSFSGGFVGVDVFFVISGYLITGIIINQRSRGTFTLTKFYERRARRILPALLFIMLCCIPFALLLMSPVQIMAFSQSLIAVCLFGSNIFFWKGQGYFASGAEEIPLMHTWSLAVEEQFYIFFPLCIILLWRFGRRPLVTSMILAAIASLLLSEWGWRTHPDANFFLLPTRAWELLVGSLCAFAHFQNEHRDRNLVSLLGLIMILLSVVLYSDHVPFPSVYALLPVLGTALIILYGGSTTVVGRLLSTRAFVGLGLISYSAYLWHQPLFAFARIKSQGTPDAWLMLGLAIMSVVLAYFTWRYVELPFRGLRPGVHISRRQLLASVGIPAALFISFGTLVNFNHGFARPLDDHEVRIVESVLAYRNYPASELYRERRCFLMPEQSASDFSKECDMASLDDNGVMIWGDSHAAALSYGLRQNIPNLAQYTATTCPPIIRTEIAQRGNCEEINEYVFQQAVRQQPSAIVLHANWLEYTDQAIENLESSIKQLKATLPHTSIYIVGGVPQWIPSLPEALLPYFLEQGSTDITTPIDIETNIEDIESRDQVIEASTLSNDAIFISVLARLCHDGVCRATSEAENTSELFIWDDGHLTRIGSLWLVNEILGDLRPVRTGRCASSVIPSIGRMD